MTEVESQLVVHEVAVRLLEPMDYQTILEEAKAWYDYISRLAGPTEYFYLFCILYLLHAELFYSGNLDVLCFEFLFCWLFFVLVKLGIS